MHLTKQQVDLLLKQIHSKRVLTRANMAYVEAHDIKAELNRVFGFANWCSDVQEQHMIFEDEVTMGNNKHGWNVAYRSLVRLTICALDGTYLASYTEGHVGDSTHPVRSEAHGNALTNSESYALKRCAVMLGDQFGLSLYNKGSLAPIVRWTLQAPPEETEEQKEATDREPADVHPESLEVEPEPEVRERSGATFVADAEHAQQLAYTLWAGPTGDSPKAWLAGIVKEASAARALSTKVTAEDGSVTTLKTVIERTAKMIA
jgi:Rad52/22 family double-strand break repair protein